MRSLCAFVSAASLFVALTAPCALAATLEGTVTYEGKIPKLKSLKMDADPGCAKKHSGPVKPDLLVLGEGNALANILVWVKNPPAKSHSTPSQPVVMDQKGCKYIPHVLGIMVGQTFNFQYWYRVPGMMRECDFSDAISATFCE